MSESSKAFPAFLFSISSLIITLLALSGCNSNENPLAGNCGSCHTMILDNAHQFECTVCHRGNSTATTATLAHADMLSQPAHPDHFVASCGSCHSNETKNFPDTLHFTLNNFVNLVRTLFEENDSLTSLAEIPIVENPETPSELADDMLRRRCLRCHLFSSGDTYAATVHATGCGACHLEYSEGKLVDHHFNSTPKDAQCLSCHYGNRVGFDYFGYFEHDFNQEYRTPYTTDETTYRPYGVDYHQLSADVHQQRGLACIDCHGRNELMKPESVAGKTSCAACHNPALLSTKLPEGVKKDDRGYYLISKHSKKRHELPLLKHQAHALNESVTCQACHAQWSYNDTATHLLRSDLDEYDSWSRLTVQGSSEVEGLLEHNLDYDNEELPPATTDKITGDIRSGVWYKGFTMRRWETVTLGYNQEGMVSVMRPLLNLTLSWIDEEENVMFDGYSVQAKNQGMTPYTPHTTGPAGIFYEERLRHFHTTKPSVKP